ncbi:MAG TPA: PTS sugar transporter subunit IIA [Gemmatimonadales bacterium]|nr:PTS sugar transporter subunit IIA [Gemmatimonadales bacterium]
MRLRDLISPTSIDLDLRGGTKHEVLAEMVALLGLSPEDCETITNLVREREAEGSTGVGQGIAIPHCRSPVFDRVRLAFGRHAQGVAYDAMDGEPVHALFLIAAPPVEVSNLYLTVLAQVARFVRKGDVPGRLASLTDLAELYGLMEQKGV